MDSVKALPRGASELYRQAAGIEPVANSVVTDETGSAAAHCIMCGAALKQGEPANRLTSKTFGDAFNNGTDLRAVNGKYKCGDCEALGGRTWLQTYSKSFATRDGVWKFASNEQIASLLLDPPEPPFAAILSTKNMQHMIWRTPVTLSRNLITVRLNDDLLQIRRPVLLAALAAYHRIHAIMAETPSPSTGRLLKPPAALFSIELASSKVGVVRADVAELLYSVGEGALAEQLNRLAMGECWALGIVRHFDPASPPAHQRVDSEEDIAARREARKAEQEAA